MDNTVTVWTARGLLIAVPPMVLLLLSAAATRAERTFDRGEIRSGKRRAALLLSMALLHPLQLVMFPGFSLPAYYFSALWVSVLAGAPLAAILARAELDARRNKWRSPRYWELSKPRNRDAEWRYTRWRFRLATDVARGAIDLFRLKGAARRAAMIDLPDALDREEERQAELEEKARRRRRRPAERNRIEERAFGQEDPQPGLYAHDPTEVERTVHRSGGHGPG